MATIPKNLSPIFIMVSDHGIAKVKKIQAHVVPVKPFHFAVHRSENPNYDGYVISEMRTGLQISNEHYKTLKEAGDTLTDEFVERCKRILKRNAEDFKPYKKMIKEAYEDDSASLRWTFFTKEDDENWLE